MKCWECKKETDTATRCHYVWYNKYTGEPIGTKTRDICPECYQKLKFNPTHHIKVETIRGKAIK